MGACLCKGERPREVTPAVSLVSIASSVIMEPEPKRQRFEMLPTMGEIIVEIMLHVRRSQASTEEAAALAIIHEASETVEGWCYIMVSLIERVPPHEALGATTIYMIFDACQLPMRDTVIGFTRSLNLCREMAAEAFLDEDNENYVRNLLLLLNCIADKFTGPITVQVLTDDMLDYFIVFLIDERSPTLSLLALIAMEKFAATKEGREAGDRALARMLLNPLLPLELHDNSSHLVMRQVGFCARWALDNIFFFPGRQLSYETVDMRRVHVTLNQRDMSPSIKLSPDGLEARCDSHFFESVRATFEVTYGVWYYEVELITAGVMQIGWATKATAFEPQEGVDVGDDEFSLGYDGCRREVRQRARTLRHERHMPRWEPGDVIGCLVDVPKATAVFSLNGHAMPEINNIFEGCRYIYGFFPAASFMAHQQCRFNFGSTPFRHPPTDRAFQNMNEYGKMTVGQKTIVPRHVILGWIRQRRSPSFARCCLICLDAESRFGLGPCCHKNIGYCEPCLVRLRVCPVCRRRAVFSWTLTS